jgi:hypothetical protein
VLCWTVVARSANPLRWKALMVLAPLFLFCAVALMPGALFALGRLP